MKQKARIKVRFNLGKGVNYLKWKITYPTGEVAYYNPTDVQLVMDNCELRNSKKTATKIFNGGEKVVCAWILCEKITIITENFTQYDTICTHMVSYNPRVTPNWVCEGINVDGMSMQRLGTVDRQIWLVH
jgi:hypothetical protein